MDANQGIWRPRFKQWALGGCALIGLVMAAADAQAAPMRGTFAPRATAAAATTTAAPLLTPAWDRFLSDPDRWATRRTPPFSLLVRRAVWRVLNGDPASAAANPMIDYLVWRRDLNPYRFDRYHPNLGPRLGQLLPQAVDPPALAPLTAVPLAPVPPPVWPLAPLTTTPPQVPEPGGAVLIVLVSAWGVWKRRGASARTRGTAAEGAGRAS